MKQALTVLAGAAAVMAFTTRAAPQAAVTVRNAGTTGAPADHRSTSVGQDAFAEDREAIKAVMREFQESIRTHDLARMQSLFVNGKIVWVGAGHPESYRFYARSLPKMKQVDQVGAFQFLGDTSFARVPMEEQFFRPTIDTDGQVALASFDYLFRFNGAVSNWGREYWQLAKDGTSWKILHLLYSYNAIEVKPLPATYR